MGMRIKGICALACLALALFGAAALAQGEGVIVQSACNIVPSGEYDLVHCYAQVRNDSDQIICLDEGVLQLMSGEALLASERVSNLWPAFLAPGEEGYLFDIVTFEKSEDGQSPSITGLHYDVKYMTIEEQYAGQSLPVQARIEPIEEHGRMTVICEVENPLETEVYDAALAIGLYSEAGQLLYADGVNLFDVGIPAGSRVFVRMRVDSTLVEQWTTYNAAPTQVRATAMVRTNAD